MKKSKRFNKMVENLTNGLKKELITPKEFMAKVKAFYKLFCTKVKNEKQL